MFEGSAGPELACAAGSCWLTPASAQDDARWPALAQPLSSRVTSTPGSVLASPLVTAWSPPAASPGVLVATPWSQPTALTMEPTAKGAKTRQVRDMRRIELPPKKKKGPRGARPSNARDV